MFFKFINSKKTKVKGNKKDKDYMVSRGVDFKDVTAGNTINIIIFYHIFG